jgi:hypothetical protein
MFDLLDAGATNLFELGCQSVRLIKLLHVVAASYAFADEKNVWHCSPTRHMCQKILELWAQWMQV